MVQVGSPTRQHPCYPQQAYKDAGWMGWGDWLGTGTVANRTSFLPFEKARDIAHTLKLKKRGMEGVVHVVASSSGQDPRCPRSRLQAPGLGQLGRLAWHRQPVIRRTTTSCRSRPPAPTRVRVP